MAMNDDTTAQHAEGDAAAAGTGTSSAQPGLDSAKAKAADATQSARESAGVAATQADDAFNEKPELFVAGAFAAGLGFAVLLRALGGGSDD